MNGGMSGRASFTRVWIAAPNDHHDHQEEEVVGSRLFTGARHRAGLRATGAGGQDRSGPLLPRHPIARAPWPWPPSWRSSGWPPTPSGPAAGPHACRTTPAGWTVVFLGDSITSGHGLPLEVAFPHRLGAALGVPVRNAGISVTGPRAAWRASRTTSWPTGPGWSWW